MEVVVDIEVARAEINGWLDYKKITPAKRQAHKEFIESLVEAVSIGALTIDEEKVITHNLLFPLEGMKEIKYKPRISTGLVEIRLKGVDNTNANAMFIAYIGALSNVNVGLINKLDTEDFKIARAVASFFI